MPSERGRRGSPTAVEPGAYAVIRGDEPRVFLAEDAAVISRLLALEVVARTDPRQFSTPSRLEAVREALLAERWADALLLWISETGLAVDVYPEALRVWTHDDLDAEQASMEIRVAPIFDR